MTKRDMIHFLEPLADDVEIVCIDPQSFNADPASASLHTRGYQLVIVIHPEGNSVTDVSQRRIFMPIETVLPSDHPMKKAWNAWQETDEFKNVLKWSVATKYDDGRPIDDIQREQHVKGGLWLAFTKGMEAQ